MSFTVAVIVIPPIIIVIIIIIIIVVVVFVIITSAAGAVAKYCDEYVCLCVCLFAMISQEPHVRSLPNVLCTLPMSVSRSSSGTLTIGRIAYGREGGDGSAQRGRSVIYDALLLLLLSL